MGFLIGFIIAFISLLYRGEDLTPEGVFAIFIGSALVGLVAMPIIWFALEILLKGQWLAALIIFFFGIKLYTKFKESN